MPALCAFLSRVALITPALPLGLSVGIQVCKRAGYFAWRVGEQPLNREPIFNVPGVVVWLLASFFAVHALLWLLPDNWSEWLLTILAFIPARFSAAVPMLPGGHVASFSSLVTHLFVHGNMPHLLINAAWLLAFGSPVARRTDALRFMVFFFLTGIAGALFYLLINGPAPIVVVGASGAISGLMGAAFRFVFAGLELGGVMGPADAMRTAPLMSLADTLRDRRILLAIAAWTVLNVVLAWGATSLVDGAGIAWEAHLGGFYAGLLTFGLFARTPSIEDNEHNDAAGAS